MPVTPLHYPVAYLMYRLNKKLSLHEVIIGAMVPDLEVPVIFLLFRNRFLNDRLVLHSLLGAATVGTILAILSTRSLYLHLVPRLFKVPTERVKQKTRCSVSLVISCFFGTVSHVLLDVSTHQYNPIFWPLQTRTFSPLYVNQGSVFIHLFLACVSLILFVHHRPHPWSKLLVA